MKRGLFFAGIALCAVGCSSTAARPIASDPVASPAPSFVGSQGPQGSSGHGGPQGLTGPMGAACPGMAGAAGIA